MLQILINNKEYLVKEAKTDNELRQGLKDTDKLNNNEGMLFYIPGEIQECVFTTVGMKFPIDIIFINQDQEIVDIKQNCKPGIEQIINDTSRLSEDDYIAYVLELNANSGIKIGSELDFNDELPVMKVLAQDGSTQMQLWGGERIVSRRETKILIKKAKKADLSKDDKDYRSLGRYIFKVFKGQDNRPSEYVEQPK